MKKMNLYKGAGVLLITAALVFSTMTVTANTNEEKQLSAGLLPSIALQGMQMPTTNNMQELLRGQLCYAMEIYAYDMSIYFDTDDPGTLNLIAAMTSTDFMAGGTWAGDTWYGCEYSATSNSNIWTIDETTGDMTLVGASGSSEGLNGLAYDDATSTLYGAGSTNLYTIDMATGAATLIGGFGTGGLMIGIACDNDGNLYGEDLGTDSLYSIDKNNGVATLIGSFGGIDLNYAQDCEYDKNNEILYLSALTQHAGNEGALYSVDTTTGLATYIGMLDQTLVEVACFAIPYGGSPPPEPELEIGEITGGFGISATIENVGDGEATDTDWSITLDGGLIILGKETTGTIASIPDGDSAEIKSGLILGIGKTTITVAAECAEGSSDEANATGTVLLFFVIGVS